MDIDVYREMYYEKYNEIYNYVDTIGDACTGIDNLEYKNAIALFKKDFDSMNTIIQQYIELLHYVYKLYTDAQADLALLAK